MPKVEGKGASISDIYYSTMNLSQISNQNSVVSMLNAQQLFKLKCEGIKQRVIHGKVL